MDPLRKVSPGERRPLSAATHNVFVDAARSHRATRNATPRPAPKLELTRGTVRIRNSSGQPRARFDILGLSGLVIEPSDGLEEFQNHPCFEGVTPSAGTPAFAVLQEPIPEDAIGRAVVHGVTIARVGGSSTTQFVDKSNGDATTLAAATTGPAEVLWRDSATTWALIRIGRRGA